MAHAHAFLTKALAYKGNNCLLWPYSVDSRGAPSVYRNKKTQRVARILCEARHGPPPGRRDAAHECGRQLCCTQMHLTWKTRKENNDDKNRHGTMQRGEQCAKAKLTTKQVLEIRSLAKSVQHVDIAKHYGVDPSTIGQIVRRRRWAHV
jgi:hypothetical protein